MQIIFFVVVSFHHFTTVCGFVVLLYIAPCVNKRCVDTKLATKRNLQNELSGTETTQSLINQYLE